MKVLRQVAQALVFVAIVTLLPLTMMGIWARQEVYDTDRYLASVGGLASHPEVQEAVAHRVVTGTERKLAGLDWPGFVDAVVREPKDRAELLALETDVNPFLEQRIVELLQLPAFQQLWVDINRVAHPALEQLLRGEDSAELQTSSGAVRLNLYPIYEALESALLAGGIDFGTEVEVDRDDFWLTIFEGRRLAQAQEAVDLLNRLIFGVAVLLAILAAVFLVLAHRTWLGAGMLALAVVLGMLVQGAMLGIAREFLIDDAATGTERQAVRVVFDEITDSLWRWSLGIGAVGVGLLVASLAAHYLQQREARGAINW